MAQGKITAPLPSLAEIRSGFLAEFAKLPEPIKRVQDSESYPVEQSSRLREHCAMVEREVSRLR
jgi:hypothetical protein